MSRGFFVTGTDTGVGKTLVTAALLRRLRESGPSPQVRLRAPKDRRMRMRCCCRRNRAFAIPMRS